jgi:hypothetical protein
MSPRYRWHAARYVCPECDGPTEGQAGPDWQTRIRCQDCEWVETYDPAADEFPSDELDRETTAKTSTDNDRSTGDEDLRTDGGRDIDAAGAGGFTPPYQGDPDDWSYGDTRHGFNVPDSVRRGGATGPMGRTELSGNGVSYRSPSFKFRCEECGDVRRFCTSEFVTMYRCHECEGVRWFRFDWDLNRRSEDTGKDLRTDGGHPPATGGPATPPERVGRDGRAFLSEDGPHLCDLCRRTFHDLAELADHNCRAPGGVLVEDGEVT